ncbi:MAG: glycosyltransferase, partial [Anaerolineales bacterium]
MMSNLTIVIPTFNEADNLPLLATALWDLPELDISILVVDDASPDGTGEIANQMAQENPGRLEVI